MSNVTLKEKMCVTHSNPTLEQNHKAELEKAYFNCPVTWLMLTWFNDECNKQRPDFMLALIPQSFTSPSPASVIVEDIHSTINPHVDLLRVFTYSRKCYNIFFPSPSPSI